MGKIDKKREGLVVKRGCLYKGRFKHSADYDLTNSIWSYPASIFFHFVNTIFFIDLVGKQVLKAVENMTFNKAKHMVQQNMINVFADWMNLLFNLVAW